VTMSATEERADFERALEVFATQGVEIRGHRAALWGASWQTPNLIAEHGLGYDSSLMGDDRPYRIVTDSIPIVELPVHWSLDDWEQYAYLPDPHIGSVIESPVKVAEMWRAELDGMRRYQCLFNLCVHPFLSARPGRIVALRGFIEHALELGDVQFALPRRRRGSVRGYVDSTHGTDTPAGTVRRVSGLAPSSACRPPEPGIDRRGLPGGSGRGRSAR
jgi:peptidoglycan-N-acetylglucosamine deacetylase